MQRIVTALVLVTVLLLVFFTLPPPAALGVLGIFVVIAAWEWSGFLGWPSPIARAVYAAALTLLVAGAIATVPGGALQELVLWISAVWWLCAFVWILFYPTPIPALVGVVCGPLVMVPACVAIVALLLGSERGPQYVLFMLAIVWAADIGAYFVGRRLGRTKLARSVSPGKSWEGVAGGLAAAAGVSVLGARWFGFSYPALLWIGVSVAAVSVIGDLTVSMFKRSAGLKDSGNLFPGHGGVLDRVDSVTAAVPLFLLQGEWLGLFGDR